MLRENIAKGRCRGDGGGRRDTGFIVTTRTDLPLASLFDSEEVGCEGS